MRTKKINYNSIYKYILSALQRVTHDNLVGACVSVGVHARFVCRCMCECEHWHKWLKQMEGSDKLHLFTEVWCKFFYEECFQCVQFRLLPCCGSDSVLLVVEGVETGSIGCQMFSNGWRRWVLLVSRLKQISGDGLFNPGLQPLGGFAHIPATVPARKTVYNIRFAVGRIPSFGQGGQACLEKKHIGHIG